MQLNTFTHLYRSFDLLYSYSNFWTSLLVLYNAFLFLAALFSSLPFQLPGYKLTNLHTSRQTSGCCFPICCLVWNSNPQFQPTTARLFLNRYLFTFHIPMEHSGSPHITRQCNRERRLISHSVQIFCHHKVTFFNFIDTYVRQSSTHILRVIRTCSVSLYSTEIPMFCIGLHRHW